LTIVKEQKACMQYPEKYTFVLNYHIANILDPIS
jgi:hypothetical protein